MTSFSIDYLGKSEILGLNNITKINRKYQITRLYFFNIHHIVNKFLSELIQIAFFKNKNLTSWKYKKPKRILSWLEPLSHVHSYKAISLRFTLSDFSPNKTLVFHYFSFLYLSFLRTHSLSLLFRWFRTIRLQSKYFSDFFLFCCQIEVFTFFYRPSSCFIASAEQKSHFFFCFESTVESSFLHRE